MATTRNRRLVLLSFAAVIVLPAVILLMYLAHIEPEYVGYKDRLAKREFMPLGPFTLPSAWVISGSPKIRVNEYGQSHYESFTSGIWECTGPAQFEWHYPVDESIYILEGAVQIEYLGKKFTLNAGDSTHFAAGTVAKWTVPERVKKTYAIYEPGRLVRLMRRIFGPVAS